jgi:anti-sigma B factor antagonist
MSQDTLTIDASTERNGAVQVFTLAGSLDIATSAALRTALIDAAERNHHELVVDLTHVEFLDSTGLGALIGAHKRATEHQGAVRLVAQEGQILRLLRITGLLTVFPVYPTLHAALDDEKRLVGMPKS